MDDCHDLGDFDLFRPEDVLYRRVLEHDVRDGRVTKGHCPTKQWKAGLSCNWSVVTPPERANRRLSLILIFTVGDCRNLGIEVRYCPVVDLADPDYNLAHCLLFLPPDVLRSRTEIDDRRRAFLQLCRLGPWRG